MSKIDCHYCSRGYWYRDSAVEINRQIARLVSVGGGAEGQGAGHRQLGGGERQTHRDRFVLGYDDFEVTE